MDVCYSIDVTDSGIVLLCDPDLIKESTAQESQTSARGWKSERERCRKISAPSASHNHVSGCMVWFPRLLVRGIRRYSVVDEKQVNNKNNREPNLVYDDDNSPQWPEDEEQELMADGEIPPTCIKSLRRLEILGTSITPSGIQMISAAASPIITIVTWIIAPPPPPLKKTVICSFNIIVLYYAHCYFVCFCILHVIFLC